MPRCKICKKTSVIFFHRIKNFSYYFCQSCQTLFVHPQPSQREIDKYYQREFQYQAGKFNEERIRKRAKIILNRLKKLVPFGKTLLDIGSGHGYFLDESLKFNLQLTGVEPSKQLVTSPIYRKIKVENTSFDNYFIKNKNKRFDFITMIHLIEHIKNPRKWLKKTSQLLNTNGILYIETPNLNSHLFWTEKQNYTFLTPPDHLWIFSLKSFQRLLEKEESLKIIKTSTYSEPEHFMGIIKGIIKKIILKKKIKTFSQPSPTNQSKTRQFQQAKYRLFDQIVAPFFTPLLNLGGYGSILELYIIKI